MPACPLCKTDLQTVRQREGVYYYCAGCQGRAVTVPQVRRMAGDKFATALLRRINSAASQGHRNCPFCDQRMCSFQIPNPELTLDACKSCGAIWFDPAEYETLPEQCVESVNEVRMRGSEAIALAKMKEWERTRTLEDPIPDESWKWIPGILGMPVELDEKPLSRRPWVVWSTAAMMTLVTLITLPNLLNIVNGFGLVPNEVWRYGGFTLISSFFLHGGIFHLVSNLYFLLLVGDNVEDDLGPWRTVLLLVIASLAGDVLHVMGNPGSTIPCVGASGGISGLLAYYALRFPRNRLGMMLRFWWFQIPAWGAFVLWVLTQFLGMMQQLMGLSRVSALAHLGGAAAGIAFWAKFCWGKGEDTPTTA